MSEKIKIAYRKEYVLDLRRGHKFPIDKYRLIPETLLEECTISENNIFAPEPVSRDIVELTHSPEYVERLLSLSLTDREIRKIGFPLTEELIAREFIITQGTIDGAISAFENGVALNAAGGTHHAYRDRGEGFCLFNDCAVAANYLLHKNIADKILIVDLDVHQGNGTAKIFEHSKNVFTFSMHGASNYPLHKEKSDLDVPLKFKTDDKTYMKILTGTLPKLIDEFHPQFIFYIAGADVLATDKWGMLGMSLSGAAQRDEFVFETARKFAIPIMVSMGGGYSPNIEHIVEAHCNTFRLAIKIFS